MKSKIVIFKVLAAIIAVGGAFASVSANSALAATSIYIRYTTTTDATVQQYCTFIANACDAPTGGNLCQVVIRIGATQQTVNGKYTPSPSTSCASAIVSGSTTNTVVNAGNPKVLPPTAILL